MPNIFLRQGQSSPADIKLSDPLVGVIAVSGSASGTSGATAIGVGIAQASGASAGIAEITAVGRAIIPASGSAQGVATAAAVGRAFVPASGSSAGQSTVSTVGRAIVPTSGVSAGTSIATAVGEAAGGTEQGIAAPDLAYGWGHVGVRKKRPVPQKPPELKWLKTPEPPRIVEAGGISRSHSTATAVGMVLASPPEIRQAIMWPIRFSKSHATARGVAVEAPFTDAEIIMLLAA